MRRLWCDIEINDIKRSFTVQLFTSEVVKIMTVVNKVNFDKIWESIKEIDSTAGLFLFRDPSKKKTWKEKFFGLTVPTHAVTMTALVGSTLEVTRCMSINVIMCGLAFIAGTTNYFVLWKIIKKKDILKDLFDWCRSLYDVENNFHPVVQEIVESHLITVEKKTVKYLKWFKIVFYVDAVIATLVYAIIGQLLLPESIYPKFSVPLPFYLPFKQQETWVAFITTVITQMICFLNGATIFIFIFGIFFTIVMHIFGMLDSILEAIGKLKLELFTSLKGLEEKEDEVPTVRGPKLQLAVLALINQKMADKTNQTSFAEWMQILTDMISDVNFVILTLGKFYSTSFLFAEVISLVTLLICGLTFTVIKQHHLFSVGCTVFTILFFIICYINEKILEKFENIKEALYDFPWYGMDSKQRKMLSIMMNCDEIQKGFNATGIHNLTLQRFRIIVKAGYDNVLVLKKIATM